MKVYIVIWRQASGREVYTGPFLTGGAAERRLARERREWPPGDFRVERVPASNRGVFGRVLLIAAHVLLLVASVVLVVALLARFA